jgi:hypothetical protein
VKEGNFRVEAVFEAGERVDINFEGEGVYLSSGREVIGQGMPASTRLAYVLVDVDMKYDKQDKEKPLRV